MKWIDGQLAAMRQIAEKAARLDRRMVEADIAARRADRALAEAWIAIQPDLKKRGLKPRDFCKQLGDGCSYPMMRRRVQLVEAWDTYIERRRAAADSGRYGLTYALELIALIADEDDDATESHEREWHYLVLPSSPKRAGQPPEVRFGPDGDGASYGGRTGRHKDNGENTTPRPVFAMLGQGCTLDVACTPESAMCPTFITEEQDALRCDWPPDHIAWMNSPYTNIYAWITKAVEYVESGRGKAVKALLPGWTDTPWFHDYAPLAKVTLIRGRQKFGAMRGAAPFPSILFEFTAASIREGRARLARGDHTIRVSMVDLKNKKPLPTLPSPTPKRYWLTTPERWQQLRSEFPGIVDLYPYPYTKDAFALKRWPPCVYLNVPFRTDDDPNGRSMRDHAREAVRRHQTEGCTVVFAGPSHDFANAMFAGGAEGRSLGRERWLEVDSGERCPNPSPSALFILRGNHQS